MCSLHPKIQSARGNIYLYSVFGNKKNSCKNIEHCKKESYAKQFYYATFKIVIMDRFGIFFSSFLLLRFYQFIFYFLKCNFFLSVEKVF